MKQLKAIQQRVFCIFLRPYQRSTGQNSKSQPVNKISEAIFEEFAWYDPSLCPPCPNSGDNCPVPPSDIRPLGPSNLISSYSSGRLAITDPVSNRILEAQEQALQYYNYPSEGKQIKSYLEADSRTLQPFNEDKMFTEDLWFLHSTWTSFEKTKLVLRPLVDTFGFDAVMACSYIPIDWNFSLAC